ncbi:MAG: DUF2341 domain-containing protein [Hadesarchaea archaeon]|nr:DUF2341 domain-containing protein [Hadesarchaea archaeon]
MKPDCSDIRFTKADGTTLLNYYIDGGVNTSSTVIWVKDPDALAANGSHVIYMYYGSPNAASLSNGSSVFEFFEGFEPGFSGWTYTEQDTYGQLSGGPSTDWFTEGTQSYRFYGFGAGRNDWAKLAKTLDFTNVGKLIVDYRVHGYYASGTGETTYFAIRIGDNVLWSISTYQDLTYLNQEFDVTSYTGNGILNFYMRRLNLASGYYEAFWFDKIRARKFVNPEPSVSIGAEETSRPNPSSLVLENFEDVSDWFYSASVSSHGSASGAQATDWKVEGNYSYKLYASIQQTWQETTLAYLTSKNRYLLSCSTLLVSVKAVANIPQGTSYTCTVGVQISPDNSSWTTIKSVTYTGSCEITENWGIDLSSCSGAYYIRFFVSKYGPNSVTFYFDNLALSYPARYWVGGTGNWSDNAHWSVLSGGEGGASVPISNFDVFFDANSGSGTVTIDSAAYAYNLDFTGFSGTLAGSAALNIYGSLTLGGGMTWSYTGAITFASTATGNTLTFNGKSTANAVTFNGAGGGWILQDDWNNGSSNITLTRGSLNTNGKTVTCGTFASSNSNTRTLTLGASTINCTSWNLSTTTNLTFDAGTSVIKCTGSFTGGGRTYYEVQLNASGSQTLSGANTFTNLKRTGGSSTDAALSLSANQTVTGTLTLTGVSRRYQLLVASDSTGMQRTITAASVSVSNVDFMDIAGAGSANWNFSSRDDVGDCGGNSGITFPASKNRYWVGNGGNWYDTARWSATSGGASGASVPLPQDDVYFDANSITSTGQTINANIARLGRNINFTGVQNSPTLNFSTANSIFGSLTLSSAMSISGTSAITFRGRGSYTLTTAGCTFTQNITLEAPGGTLTLQGDLITNNRILTVSRGTFDANNYNVVIGVFSSNNPNTRTIKMGSGTWSLTSTGTVWDTSITTNLTLNPETSTIKLTNTSTSAKTFAGGGRTYYNFWNAAAGTVTITGSNTFNDFRIDAGGTVYFTAGTTTTVNSFTATGAPGSMITISSATSATHTLSKASGIVNCDYLVLSYSVATGGAFWYAGANSVDGGNNSGWRFMSAYTPPNPPTSLLCQGQSNPTRLTTFTPTFSAIHTDNNAGDGNGDSAIKYRIQVSTDSSFATVTHWDSGASGTSMAPTASGSRCPDITYGGAPLSRGVTYYWRIKFWDATNLEGYWSQPASFQLNQLPSPVNLSTQGQTNPMRLTTFTPTFSWTFVDQDGDSQSKYEIWVGTSQGGNNKWNSGQVSSSSTSVVYGGSSLSRGVTYYVQVRVYDGYEWSDWAMGVFRINQLPSVSNQSTTTITKVYLYNYGTQDVQIDRLFVSGTEIYDFVVRDASSGNAYGTVIPAGKFVTIEFPSPSVAEFDVTIITKNKGVYTWRLSR